ncbi:hypothetical protein BV25DRAFT_1831649, partial [Artomyces pyxidatus]
MWPGPRVGLRLESTCTLVPSGAADRPQGPGKTLNTDARRRRVSTGINSMSLARQDLGMSTPPSSWRNQGG